MGQSGHTAFFGLLEFLKRASFLKIIEWAIVSLMYLWIAGFVIAMAVATVRGYVGVYREARAYERSSWKGLKKDSSAADAKRPSIREADHAHHSTYGDSG